MDYFCFIIGIMPANDFSILLAVWYKLTEQFNNFSLKWWLIAQDHITLRLFDFFFQEKNTLSAAVYGLFCYLSPTILNPYLITLFDNVCYF